MEIHKSKELVLFLENELEQDKDVTRSTTCEYNNVRLLCRKIEYAQSIALTALSAAMRMIALCESNNVYDPILNDPDCADIKGIMTHALCAASSITPQEKERIEVAMLNASVLFNPADIHLYPDELKQ